MAEQSASETPAIEHGQALADQYEIGSTRADEYDAAGEAVAPAPPQGGTANAPEPAAQTPPASERLRGADGRFLKPVKHPNYLMRRAFELGVSQGEADAMSTEELDRVVYYGTQEAIRESREATRGQLADERLSQAHRQQPEPPAAPEPLFNEASGLDPNLIEALNRQHQQIDELRQQISQLTQHHVARENETREEKIDRCFNDLGPDYAAYYGSGRLRDMDPNSEQYERRRAAAGAALSRKGPGSLESKIVASARKLAGVAAPVPAPPKGGTPMTEEQRAWAAAGLALPTARKPSEEPRGVRKALATASRMIREEEQLRGGEEDGEFYNGFLGAPAAA